MTNQSKIIIAALALAIAFSVGRFTAVGTKTDVLDVKTTEKEKEKKSVHTITKTTIVKQPDGATTTTIVADTKAETKEVDQKTSNLHQEVVSTPGPKTNISLLGSYNIISPEKVPAVGLLVSREVIGPVTAGVFGLNNGTVGISIGINF